MQEGRGVVSLFGQLAQSDRGREHRPDAVLRLHGAAELSQQRRILAVKIENLFDLVAQQEERTSLAEELAAKLSDRREEVLELEVRDFDADGVETLFGVEQSV